MNNDYYQVFGLPENCSDQEIRTAYRKLAHKFHPDKNGNDTYFEERFKELQQAYEVLSDPLKRRVYDSTRHGDVKESPNTKVKDSSTNSKQRVKPSDIADNVEEIYRGIKLLDAEEVNKVELRQYLDSILNDTIVNQLIRISDIDSNERIADASVGFLKFVTVVESKQYLPFIIKLAGSNNTLLIRINKAEKDLRANRRDRISTEAVRIFFAIGLIAFFAYAYLNDNSSPSKSVRSPQKSASFPPKMNTRFLGNQLKTGESPYDAYFGKGIYDRSFLNRVIINNGNQFDAIVCLANSHSNRVVRNEYIRAGESFTMTNVPNGTYYLKTFAGNNWNPDTLLLNGRLRGYFDTDAYFSVSDDYSDLIQLSHTSTGYSVVTITLYLVRGGNMESRNISSDLFFRTF